jgi:hypothetical protein
MNQDNKMNKDNKMNQDNKNKYHFEKLNIKKNIKVEEII